MAQRPAGGGSPLSHSAPLEGATDGSSATPLVLALQS